MWHCPTLSGNAALELAQVVPRAQRKKGKNALCYICTFLFNVSQNFIGYVIFIQTVNIYYLTRYEVFTLTQSCELNVNCI